MKELNKNYQELKRLFLEANYNISVFEDSIYALLSSEYFLVDTNRSRFSITVFQTVYDNQIEVYVEEKRGGQWYRLSQKFYKTPRGAFNYISRIIKELNE